MNASQIESFVRHVGACMEVGWWRLCRGKAREADSRSELCRPAHMASKGRAVARLQTT